VFFESNSVICAGITDDQAMGSDGEDDLPVLKRIEADLKSSSNTDISSPDGKQVDLFSEIHLNELKKLEKQLEQVRISIVKTVTMRSIY
jgi:protein bicaudal D